MQGLCKVAGAALLLAAGAAIAHNYRTGELRVQHPWARATPTGERQATVYMRIQNTGSVADYLLGASSPAAARVEIRAADGTASVIELPGRKTAKLEPGGAHLFLTGLTQALVKGDRIPVRLRFDRSGETGVEVEVQSAESRRPRH